MLPSKLHLPPISCTSSQCSESPERILLPQNYKAVNDDDKEMTFFKFQGLKKTLQANNSSSNREIRHWNMYSKTNSAGKPQVYLQNNLELSKLMILNLKSYL